MRSLTHGTERGGRALRVTTLLTLVISVFGIPATASAAVGGGLKQADGAKGCLVDEVGVAGCEQVRALQNVGRIAVSPDGQHVYAPSRALDAVVVFNRAANGVLTQKAGTEGCYTSNGTTAVNEGCSTGPPAISGLVGANDVAVSPDGENVYVAGPGSNVVVTFRRLDDGTLVFLNTQSAGILAINQVTVAPDNRSVYVSSLDHGGIVGHFRRDLTNGTLTFGGCQASDTTYYGGCALNALITGPSDLEVSPDNASVAVANESYPNWDVLALDRNVSGTASHGNLAYGGISKCVTSNSSLSATCQVRIGQYYPRSIAFDGDSRIYVASQYSLLRLDRNTSNGVLTPSTTPSGCATYSDGSPAENCSSNLLFNGFYPLQDVAVRPGNSNVYVGSQASDPSIIGYARGAGGEISQLPSPLGCINPAAAQSCGTFRSGVAISSLDTDSGGQNLYAAGGNRLFTFSFDRPPVCQNVGANTAHNTSVAVKLSCSDPDGDAVTYEKLSDPGKGALGGVQGDTVNYIPLTGSTGSDSFSYRAVALGVASDTATATVNVAGPTAPPPSPPSPPGLIPSTVSNNWAASARFTQVITLSAKRLPAGARVVVACKTKSKRLQKKRCPYKSKSFKAPAGKAQVNLAKQFRKKKLPLATTIKITITAPNFIGKVFTYTIRKRRIPRLKLTCLAPGSTTKSAKCS